MPIDESECAPSTTPARTPVSAFAARQRNGLLQSQPTQDRNRSPGGGGGLDVHGWVLGVNGIQTPRMGLLGGKTRQKHGVAGSRRTKSSVAGLNRSQAELRCCPGTAVGGWQPKSSVRRGVYRARRDDKPGFKQAGEECKTATRYILGFDWLGTQNTRFTIYRWYDQQVFPLHRIK